MTLPYNRLLKIVFIDIDGCINLGKGKPIDLIALKVLREFNENSETDLIYPKITFITGRPVPYVEALLQIVNGKVPAVCENGGIIYYPTQDSFRYLVTESELKTIKEVKEIIQEYLIKKYPGTKIEPGKETMISLNPPPKMNIEKFYMIVKEEIKSINKDLTVTRSLDSVDISPRNTSKLFGMKAVLSELSIGLEETCVIGDSIGDLEILEAAAFSAAPANAEEVVKAKSRYVSRYENGKGVIDIVKICREINKKAIGRL